MTNTFTCDDQIRGRGSNRTWYSADKKVVVYMDGLSRWWRLTEDGECCYTTAREAFSGIEAVPRQG
jgi:hypothetical protein